MNRLSVILEEELAAIELYMHHSILCDNCGFDMLRDVLKQHAIEEMNKTQKQVQNILEQEGIYLSGEMMPFFRKIEMEEGSEDSFATEQGPWQQNSCKKKRHKFYASSFFNKQIILFSYLHFTGNDLTIDQSL